MAVLDGVPRREVGCDGWMLRCGVEMGAWLGGGGGSVLEGFVGVGTWIDDGIDGGSSTVWCVWRHGRYLLTCRCLTGGVVVGLLYLVVVVIIIVYTVCTIDNYMSIQNSNSSLARSSIL